MRVTVCELPDERKAFASVWPEFVSYVKQQQSDLVLLPELPFNAWFARTPQFNAQVWQDALEAQERVMGCVTELAPAIVLGSRLLVEEGLRLNRGFYWTPTDGFKGVHDKYYFPNEPDFYEGNWFDRNQRDFTLAHVQDLSLGFLLCTEVMFNEWARFYGRQGANIIAAPRASTKHDRWTVAPRMAAIASGAFVISSNRVDDQLFAGMGLVIGPDGDVLASTSRQIPFVTVDINLEESAQAQKSYPRDVPE
jgi:predicted amidohydrolase